VAQDPLAEVLVVDRPKAGWIGDQIVGDDAEAERFAAMKNIQDAVLRAMAGKRKFMKLYPLIRNLVFNPKCPIDVSLALLPHMLLADLKNLSMNKEVSDTVRKAATRLFAQRADTRKARD